MTEIAKSLKKPILKCTGINMNHAKLKAATLCDHCADVLITAFIINSSGVFLISTYPPLSPLRLAR